MGCGASHPPNPDTEASPVVVAVVDQPPPPVSSSNGFHRDWDSEHRHFASLENQVVSYISFRAAQGLLRWLAQLCHQPLEQLTSHHCREYFRANRVYPPTWQAVPPQELFKKPPGDYEDMLLLLPGEEPEPMRVCQYFVPQSSDTNTGTIVLTYAWQEPLWGVLNAIECSELGQSIKLGGVSIWIDILFIHQGVGTDIVRELELAQKVYSQSLDHYCTSAQAMSRAWCLFELWTRWNTQNIVGTFPKHSNRCSTAFLWDESLAALIKLEGELHEHHDQPYDYFNNMSASVSEDKAAIQAAILKQCSSAAQFNMGVHNHLVEYVMGLMFQFIERQGRPDPRKKGRKHLSSDMHDANIAELPTNDDDERFAASLATAGRGAFYEYWPKTEAEQQRINEGLLPVASRETGFERLFTGRRYQESSDLAWERMGGRDLVLRWLALPEGSEQRRQMQDDYGNRLLDGASNIAKHTRHDMAVKFWEGMRKKQGTGLKTPIV